MIEFGYRNYKNNKSLYGKTTVSIALGVFLILFFALLQIGTENLIEKELVNDPDLHLVSFSSSILSEDSGKEIFDIADLEKISKLEYVTNINVNICSKTEIVKAFLDEAEIYIPPLYLLGVDNTYDTFSMTQLFLGQKNDPDFNPIIAGRDFRPNDTLSALVEENCVIAYGMEPDEIIGRTIKICTETDIIEITIVGVYSSDIGYNTLSDGFGYYIDGKLDVVLESTIVTKDVIAKIDCVSEAPYDYINISCDTLDSTTVLYENLSQNYSNNIIALIDQINTVQNYLRIFGNIFIFSGILLFTIALFNMNSVVVLNAEKRKKWFTIQYLIGFTKKEVAKTFSFEILLAVLKGYIIGVLIAEFAALVTDGAIHIYAADYLNAGAMPFSLPLPLSGIILAVVLIFSLLLSINNSIKIYKLDPIDVLRGQ